MAGDVRSAKSMSKVKSAPLSRLIHACIVWAYGIYWWAVFCAVLLAFGFLIVSWPGTRAQRRRIARFGARLLFRLTGMPLHVDGLDRLPSGPHILLVNHTSFLDPLVLTAAMPVPPGYAFVARQQYRSQALLWPLLRAVGTVVLHRHGSHASPSNIDILLSAIRSGQNLIVFPEGAIHRTAGVRPFHSGAFVSAWQAGTSLVVAGIHGARKALPLKSWRPVRTGISVRIGAVLDPHDIDKTTMEKYTQVARDRMAPLTGEKIAGS